MNLFEGRLTGIGDGFELHIGGQRLRLPNDFVSGRSGLGNYVGKSVIFGVRPEDFEDATMADDRLELPRLKAKIELVESLGSEIIAHFDIGQTRLADVILTQSRTFQTMSRRSGALIQEARLVSAMKLRLYSMCNVSISLTSRRKFQSKSDWITAFGFPAL